MRLKQGWAALFLVATPLSIHAAPPKVSAEQKMQMAKAAERGLQIYHYDQAAWHTTDTMLEDVKREDMDGVKGWVVTPDPKGWRATYYKRNANGPYGVYSAVWSGRAVVDRKLLANAADALLSPQQQALIKARDAAAEAAIAGKLILCADRPFNTVTLPGATAADPISVYLLTPQTVDSIFPMGGHHLLQFIDNKEITRRSFSTSCINTSGAGDLPKGAKPVALYVTHLLDPVPTEIHVFTALTAKMQVYVGTSGNKLTWVVSAKDDKPKIGLVDAPKTKGR
jgi:hypothetical protein